VEALSLHVLIFKGLLMGFKSLMFLEHGTDKFMRSFQKPSQKVSIGLKKMPWR